MPEKDFRRAWEKSRALPELKGDPRNKNFARNVRYSLVMELEKAIVILDKRADLKHFHQKSVSETRAVWFCELSKMSAQVGYWDANSVRAMLDAHSSYKNQNYDTTPIDIDE